ncbi:RIMS-binding protein 3-like [Sarcoramphus papa]
MSRDGVGRGPAARSRPLPCRGPVQKDEHKQQLERLRAELEAERLRSQELRRRFTAETRELKEAAERDRRLLAERLHSTWEQRQARELQRLRELNQRQRAVEIRQLLRSKEAELREVQGTLQQQRDDAIRQARDLQQQLAKELVRGDWSSSKARGKLQDVLSKLPWETNGEQAAHILRLQDELLLQRRLFLKYILERFEGEQPASCHEAYSYDPFDGPNEQPELELPLVAGQYVYIFGDVDEDGWHVGELTDGTRGFVPSNLVEEVSDDDLMTAEPPETSDW